MASIFLSYDRDDRGAAKVIAAALEKAGHSVWWDKHISGGTQYTKEIEQALNRADVVVVLWSSSSVESPWVRDEAGSGRDKGRLVPLSFAATPPPLGFRQFQSIDLGRWQGRGKVPRLEEILAAIERQSRAWHSAAGASFDKAHKSFWQWTAAQQLADPWPEHRPAHHDSGPGHRASMGGQGVGRHGGRCRR